ncbi:ComEA family DNA-binding protein [Vreelandella lionensis]|uniref:ComEA family DNA-binding protein n=1 Tax=Vreelandella lionensis TaxID=1144478 RepID=UPI0009F1F596|nr:ComEA family DNA-binding protein [Halomonas lionensis]
MQTTFKRIAAALLISLSLGLSGTALAQAIAPINVNSADEELLAELPGIGPSRATAIIEEREANGAFENADDLTRVNGIGPATVDRIRDQIKFEE